MKSSQNGKQLCELSSDAVRPPKVMPRSYLPPKTAVRTSQNVIGDSPAITSTALTTKAPAAAAQSHLLRAAHLNTNAPVFVPRSMQLGAHSSIGNQPDVPAALVFVPQFLRAAAQNTAQSTGTKGEPAVQSTAVASRSAASPEKPSLDKHLILQRLLSAKQNTGQPSHDTQAQNIISALQPAAHALAISPAQAQRHDGVDVQHAANETPQATLLDRCAAQPDQVADQSGVASPSTAATCDTSSEVVSSHMQCAAAAHASVQMNTSGLQHATASTLPASMALPSAADIAAEIAAEKVFGSSVSSMVQFGHSICRLHPGSAVKSPPLTQLKGKFGMMDGNIPQGLPCITTNQVCRQLLC